MSLCLSFSRRFYLSEFFVVVPDLTTWDGEYDPVSPRGQSETRSLVRTPRRAQASFAAFTQGMALRRGNTLPHSHGVYVIGFTDPRPAIYVGIAANDGIKPEGILTRLRRHRVKATGSHVNRLPNLGGISHPKRWGDFASSRHASFQERGKVDLLEDVVIMTGSLGPGADARSALLFFEQMLSLPADSTQLSDLNKELVNKVFGGHSVDVFSLNTQSSRGAPLAGASVVFDGQPAIHLGLTMR